MRQERYLRALRTVPNVTTHLGKFINKPKVRPLETPLAVGTTHVRVINTEEKGSDVNLATYLEQRSQYAVRAHAPIVNTVRCADTFSRPGETRNVQNQ